MPTRREHAIREIREKGETARKLSEKDVAGATIHFLGTDGEARDLDPCEVFQTLGTAAFEHAQFLEELEYLDPSASVDGMCARVDRVNVSAVRCFPEAGPVAFMPEAAIEDRERCLKALVGDIRACKATGVLADLQEVLFAAEMTLRRCEFTVATHPAKNHLRAALEFGFSFYFLNRARFQ